MLFFSRQSHFSLRHTPFLRHTPHPVLPKLAVHHQWVQSHRHQRGCFRFAPGFLRHLEEGEFGLKG